MSSLEDIRAEYDDYRSWVTSVRARIAAEVEARVANEVAGRTAEIARMLHEAYANGHTKTELRAAVRAYGNSTAWDQLWNAADGAPESRTGRPMKGGVRVPIGERVKGAVKRKKPYEFKFEGASNAVLTMFPGIEEVRPGPRNLVWTGQAGDVPAEGLTMHLRRGFRGWEHDDAHEDFEAETAAMNSAWGPLGYLPGGVGVHPHWIHFVTALLRHEIGEDGKTEL